MADPAGTETVQEVKKRKKDTTTQPEGEHPAIEVSPKSPCGAISLGRRPSYQRNPENGQKDEKNSEVCIFCMCHLAGQRLADTDA